MLTLPAPPAADEFPYAAGVWHYGRARAFSASHRDKDAQREIEALQQIIDTTPKGRQMGANGAVDVLRLAAAIARGDLLARSGKDGAPELVDAVKRYAALAYDEPPSWPLSPRLVLGRVYLDQKKYATPPPTFFATSSPHNPSSAGRSSASAPPRPASGIRPPISTRA